jgi:hypothetical protein
MMTARERAEGIIELVRDAGFHWHAEEIAAVMSQFQAAINEALDAAAQKVHGEYREQIVAEIRALKQRAKEESGGV